jgi:hypothetical protein
MKVKRGGLKLKNINKKGFKALFDMINSSSAKINLLTYEALKGFIFELSVSQNDSEYFSLKGSMFVEPVTDYILKFVVISEINNHANLLYKNFEKTSESMNSFFDEAKLQQKVWVKSILGGRPKICPPVANFSIFNHETSLELCDFLSIKTTDPSQDVFKYLYNNISISSKLKTPYKIGLLTMPKMPDSQTLYDIIESPSINKDIKNKVGANVIAQIVRLFIELGVIHFDLHFQNVLVCGDVNGKYDTLIIDFGRASDIENGKDDEYLNSTEKTSILAMKNNFYNEFLSKLSRINEEGKIKFMKDVVDYIKIQDDVANKKILMGLYRPEYSQMNWVIDVMADPSFYNYILESYEILKNMCLTEGTKILPATIKKYENMGYILKFDDINKFVVNSLDIPNQTCDSDEMCGGKKKSRKNKRKNFKKTKRNYK